MVYDFIIVGHGLAGGILARTLSRKGYKLIVFDTYKANSASRVAAGLINPIAGKRFAKSWLAEKLVPFAINFYQELEQELGIPFWHSLPILKLFSSVEEQNTWMGKSTNPALHEFIKDVHLHLPPSEAIYQEFGAVETAQSGYLEVNLFLDILLTELEKQHDLVKAPFDYNNLQIRPDFIAYSLENNTIKAQKIVFCEGYKAIENPYFNWLPFAPNKGEVLDIKIDNFSTECIYNKAVYVLPFGANRYKVGATYNWRELNEEVSLAALTELSEHTKHIIKKPFDVTNQKVGIRPAVRDRRPLMGWHPVHSNVGIFNGMGSKGVMMAPYLAKNFTKSLTGSTLEPEADIARYLKHFNKY
ncbi:NAD(P)/FAD-dependent oxidoreductase [Adhaeribacter radiodurans]|uniref:FAD-binding oxidoreductase n=1 Tax=Adhaeribacter radiodurans TaxID=2745197 RepID=A0A7L7LBG4_9BACT|nr:FAD-dependent oxidoreductase [Adhaeribacter radiodurans]QMU30188.1 FAD-binding oxidoreductase [Adhaeribacter radiodurans]